MKVILALTLLMISPITLGMQELGVLIKHINKNMKSYSRKIKFAHGSVYFIYGKGIKENEYYCAWYFLPWNPTPHIATICKWYGNDAVKAFYEVRDQFNEQAHQLTETTLEKNS